MGNETKLTEIKRVSNNMQDWHGGNRYKAELDRLIRTVEGYGWDKDMQAQHMVKLETYFNELKTSNLIY